MTSKMSVCFMHFLQRIHEKQTQLQFPLTYSIYTKVQPATSLLPLMKIRMESEACRWELKK